MQPAKDSDHAPKDLDVDVILKLQRPVGSIGRLENNTVAFEATRIDDKG